ncbi:TRAP transporter small permease subunit [Pseudophaeobacter sp.]|uniref:TRAP transporter small permease n=2 Tax=Pseudophaeobacter sp. TaxID=1971739 RepID=UPI0032D8F138
MNESGPMSEVSPAPPKVRNLLNAWHQVEVWVAVLAFSAIALLLIYDVVLREAIIPMLGLVGIDGRSLVLYGSQKIAVYLLILGAFAGIGIATWTGAQLVPKVGERIVPRAWDASANCVADLFTFAFLSAVTLIATMYVYDTFLSGQRGSSGVSIEVWKVQIALPLGFASAAVRYLAFAIWPDVRPEDGETLE